MQIINRGIMMMLVFTSQMERREMSKANEWADGLAKEREAEQRASDERDRSVELRRQIVAEQWPLLWEEVIKEFQAHCDAYNETLKPERKLYLHRELEGFFIRPDALAEIVRVRHDPHSKRINIATSQSNLSLKPSVQMSGSGEVSLADNYGRHYSPAYLAQLCIKQGTSA